MKQILHILWSLLIILAVAACTDETMVEKNSVIQGDKVLMTVNASIPAPHEIATRAIDPDGLGVYTLHLFCFDEYGAYISRQEATNFQPTETEGLYSFTVSVPSTTRTIHFLSNIYLDDITAAPGMSETTLIPSIVTASGRMVYWGRVHFEDENGLTAFTENGHVDLYRNQAQICWEVSSGLNLSVFGFAVFNSRAWGTAAPFNATNVDSPFAFDINKPYITEPGGDYRTITSDPVGVTVNNSSEPGDPHYLFESPNTLDTPVFVVMRIGETEENSKYYKIMLVDSNKNFLPIYRNYKYKISITAMPTQWGYNTFEEAKEGVAANNVWVSIDPEIYQISDGSSTLTITDGTTQIFNAGGEQFIDFTYDGDKKNLNVSWLDNDGTISGSIPEIVDESNGNYRIKLNLAQPNESPVIASLMLRAGVLSRQIKIYLMKPFQFRPVWVSTGVPMIKGERMSMTFVIPDNYPEELFPVTCKIATNKMNANNDLRVQLPIISEDCEYELYDETSESGEPITAITNWGYKFIYTATRPGVQEVFFTLNVSEGNDPKGTVSYSDKNGNITCPHADRENHTHVFLEAENFQDEEKVVLFQSANTNRRITISGAPTNNPGFLLNEVPPTVNQPVTVTLNFSEATTAEHVMRIATAALVPIESEKSKYFNTTSNGLINYYWISPGAGTTSLTLNFLTKSALVDDLVRFSIDNENDFDYNAEDDTWYKSAAMELRSNPGSYTFDFKIVDGDDEKYKVKYGIGQSVGLHFSVPESAVAYTPLKLFIKTKNLDPDPNEENKEWIKQNDEKTGYILEIPKGYPLAEEGVLKFVTNRIANAETVTISTLDDSQALFIPSSQTFENLPITGTIQISDGHSLSTTSFIVLERANGTRVGDFKITEAGAVAKYSLTLRPEYDFSMDETLTIVYNSLGTEQAIYQTYTTFRQLINHEIGESGLNFTLYKK